MMKANNLRGYLCICTEIEAKQRLIKARGWHPVLGPNKSEQTKIAACIHHVLHPAILSCTVTIDSQEHSQMDQLQILAKCNENLYVPNMYLTVTHSAKSCATLQQTIVRVNEVTSKFFRVQCPSSWCGSPLRQIAKSQTKVWKASERIHLHLENNSFWMKRVVRMKRTIVRSRQG